MNKIALAALTVSLIAAPAMAASDSQAAPAADIVAAKGKMLLAADGARLAPVYRVENGNAEIIMDGRMVSVPASTLAINSGKLTTSLTKSQVIALP